jgi:Tfp pilus assembly protein PilF
MASDTTDLPLCDPVTDAEDRLEIAIGIARNGDINAAQKTADEQVKAFPNELRVLHKAGVIKRICGDYVASLEMFHRALAAHPRFHYTEIEIADVHADRGELEDALRWYRQAIDSCPKYPVGYVRAAKLEQSLGRNWDALLIMEHMHQQLPDNIEGNVLRAEILQYHDRRPEAARAYEAAIIAGCEEAQVHFNFMRILTELGRYSEVLAHAARLTPTIGSFLEFHTKVFSGHAKFALAIDYAQTLSVAKVRECSSAWLDAERLVANLQAVIRDQQPLSLIRVGDGEARFLALNDPWANDIISPQERECIVNLIWHNWFGQPINTANVAELELLYKMFSEALSRADILGLTSVQRYERDAYHRGYLGLLERSVSGVLAAHQGVFLTDALINIELHKRSPFYSELLSRLDFLGCISPHPGMTSRLARHHGISAFQEYIIPGESRLPEAVRSQGSGPHFPNRFHEIMTTLAVPRRGAVFLVAGGLLGKIYCERIRQLGGIAIDIGSIADAWMGFDTRPGQYSQEFEWMLS